MVQWKGENFVKRTTHVIREYEVIIIIMVKKDTLQKIAEKKRNHGKTPKKYKQYQNFLKSIIIINRQRIVKIRIS